MRPARGGGPARGTWVVAACVLGAVTAGVILLLGARTWTGLVITPIAAVCVLDRFAPDLDPVQLTGRMQIGVVVTVVATVLAYLAASPPAVDAFAVAPGRRWPRAVGMVPVAALDLLFATFVLVQLAVLFGGHRRILTGEGLTYSQYAREGFGPLLAITVLTLVVVASAVHRMSLYEQAYGFTRLRLAGTAIELFGGAVLVVLLLAGTWHVRVVPAVIAVGMVGLLGLAALNPDAYIAERNIDRYERTGKIDLDYLAGLSADAVPALLRLPAGMQECALARHAALRARSDDPWFDPNRARDRARRLLSDTAIGTCASPAASPAPAVQLPGSSAVGKDLADAAAGRRGR